MKKSYLIVGILAGLLAQEAQASEAAVRGNLQTQGIANPTKEEVDYILKGPGTIREKANRVLAYENAKKGNPGLTLQQFLGRARLGAAAPVAAPRPAPAPVVVPPAPAPSPVPVPPPAPVPPAPVPLAPPIPLIAPPATGPAVVAPTPAPAPVVGGADVPPPPPPRTPEDEAIMHGGGAGHADVPPPPPPAHEEEHGVAPPPPPPPVAPKANAGAAGQEGGLFDELKKGKKLREVGPPAIKQKEEEAPLAVHVGNQLANRPDIAAREEAHHAAMNKEQDDEFADKPETAEQKAARLREEQRREDFKREELQRQREQKAKENKPAEENKVQQGEHGGAVMSKKAHGNLMEHLLGKRGPGGAAAEKDAGHVGPKSKAGGGVADKNHE